jgi:hypothetical protein
MEIQNTMPTRLSPNVYRCTQDREQTNAGHFFLQGPYFKVVKPLDYRKTVLCGAGAMVLKGAWKTGFPVCNASLVVFLHFFKITVSLAYSCYRSSNKKFSDRLRDHHYDALRVALHGLVIVCMQGSRYTKYVCFSEKFLHFIHHFITVSKQVVMTYS